MGETIRKGRFRMIIEISTQEAWKIIDASKAYPENYSVSDSVIKMFKKIQKDLQKSIKDENLGVSKPKIKQTTTKETKGGVKVSTGRRKRKTQAVVGRRATKKSD